MIFCAIFLLTRKIICAILEPQKETNEQANKPERKKNDYYWNERIPSRRAGRRKKQNAYEQGKQLLLYIQAL